MQPHSLRRKLPSCDRCRARKIKCDATTTRGCTQCVHRGVLCSFSKARISRRTTIDQHRELEYHLVSAKRYTAECQRKLRRATQDADEQPAPMLHPVELPTSHVRHTVATSLLPTVQHNEAHYALQHSSASVPNDNQHPPPAHLNIADRSSRPIVTNERDPYCHTMLYDSRSYLQPHTVMAVDRGGTESSWYAVGNVTARPRDAYSIAVASHDAMSYSHHGLDGTVGQKNQGSSPIQRHLYNEDESTFVPHGQSCAQTEHNGLFSEPPPQSLPLPTAVPYQPISRSIPEQMPCTALDNNAVEVQSSERERMSIFAVCDSSRSSRMSLYSRDRST